MIKTKSNVAKHAREDGLSRHIGELIRQRRREQGMSQSKLGDALHMTFQQIQKYEKGTNRVSAPTLHEMAAVLEVPITYFFPVDGQKVVPMPPRAGVRIELLVVAVAELASRVDDLATEFKQLTGDGAK